MRKRSDAGGRFLALCLFGLMLAGRLVMSQSAAPNYEVYAVRFANVPFSLGSLVAGADRARMVRPLTDKTSKIVYTLIYDNSMLPDDATREKDKASRTATFTRAVANMKILAEGGKLAPR